MFTLGKYRSFGIAMNRQFRTDLNANFEDVDKDIQTQKGRVDELIRKNPQPSEVVDARGGFPVLRDRLDSVNAQLAQKAPIQFETITYKIPSDFPTLQSAFDELTKRKHKSGVTITLSIEDGHLLTHGLKLNYGDYGHFIITYEGADSLKLSPTFVSVSSDFDDTEFLTDCVFVFNYAKAPVIDMVVDMEGKYLWGYVLNNRSNGRITRGSGFLNGHEGGHIRSSTLWARSTNWSGHDSYGIQITSASLADISGAIADDCVKDTSQGQISGAIDVSRGSMVYANGARADRSGSNGLDVRRSTVIVENGLFRNNVSHGIYSRDGAYVHAGYATVTGNGGHDLMNRRGGCINANSATYNKVEGTVNTFNNKGFVTDDQKPQNGGGIVARGGSKLSGYWERSDGWVYMWKEVKIDATVTSIQETVADFPFTLAQAHSGFRIGANNGLGSNRFLDISKLQVSYAINKNAWEYMMVSAGTTTDTTVTFFVEGYKDSAIFA